MGIFPAVCKHHVRRNWLYFLLKVVFNLCAIKRKKTVTEVVYHDVLLISATQELRSTIPCLTFPVGRRSQNHPCNINLLTFCEQAQNRAATTNFDIVRMRTQTEDFEAGLRVLSE